MQLQSTSLPTKNGLAVLISKPKANRYSQICKASAVKNKRLAQDKGEKTQDDIDACEYNVGQYCSINQKGERKLQGSSLGEKEQEFIGAMQTWYYEGKPTLSDAEFENLREELLWQGSKVVALTSTEQRFLEVLSAYRNGQQIISDEEFDVLKRKLKTEKSIVTQEGPRCSIRSGRMYSDCYPDYSKMVALNLPAISLVTASLFGIDYLSGQNLIKVAEIPAVYGIILVLGFAVPLMYVVTDALTRVIFKDFLILNGVCPSCGTPNIAYFGDIFTIQGKRGTALVTCSNSSCKASLEFNEYERDIRLEKEQEKSTTETQNS